LNPLLNSTRKEYSGFLALKILVGHSSSDVPYATLTMKVAVYRAERVDTSPLSPLYSSVSLVYAEGIE
jgi:hypothetical protein